MLKFIGLAIGVWLATAPSVVAGEPTITVVAGGDLLFDRGVRRRAEESGVPHLLELLRPTLAAADLSVANLECPLTLVHEPQPKAYVFRCEPEIAGHLHQAGWSALSLANNHSIDQGRQGLVDTIAHLERAGIVPLGAGASQAESQRAHFVDVGGLRVALLAYVGLVIEGVFFLEDQPAPAQLDEDNAVARIAAARAQADVVIVNVHWGVEFHTQPTEEQRRLAHRFVDAGATLVIGHHPHVLQPTERYRAGFIAYSLGNLVFDQQRPATKDTALVRCRLQRQRVQSCQAVPFEIGQARPQPASPAARARIAAILKLPLAR